MNEYLIFKGITNADMVAERMTVLAITILHMIHLGINNTISLIFILQRSRIPHTTYFQRGSQYAFRYIYPIHVGVCTCTCTCIQCMYVCQANIYGALGNRCL